MTPVEKLRHFLEEGQRLSEAVGAISIYDPIPENLELGLILRVKDDVAIIECLLEALETAEELLTVPEHCQDEEWFTRRNEVHEALARAAGICWRKKNDSA